MRDQVLEVTEMESTPHAAEESINKHVVSVSKTCKTPQNIAFKQAVDWFGRDDRMVMRKVNDGKNFYCNWLSDDSRLAVHFYEKSRNKTQIVIQHNRLPNELDAAIMKNFWKERLQQMVEAL